MIEEKKISEKEMKEKTKEVAVMLKKLAELFRNAGNHLSVISNAMENLL